MRKKLLLAIAFSLGIWVYVLLTAASARPGPAGPKAIGPEDGITAFFSPTGGTTDAIVAEINKSAKSIDVQAYSFTSPPIAKAITDACDRGVHVRVILDKVEKTDPHCLSAELQNHHIPVYLDDQHAIANNRVILIDASVIITGSFNFTKASEERNAENLLIIHDRPRLMAAYQSNFEHHLGHSVPLDGQPQQ
jgi:phosphatidylserine/phosphatidylglycerophosphate/cardiolipin synthase-like enzyme